MSFSAIATIALGLLLLQSTESLPTKVMDAGGLPSDVKYIRCETCAFVAKSAAASVNDLESTRLNQLQILDLVESLCKTEGKWSRWMLKTDLVERAGKLRLIPQEGQQSCMRECKTIALACVDVLDGIESELSEYLYKLRRASALVDETELEHWLCSKRGGLSDACRSSPPVLPRDRVPGPSFEPKSQKDVEMENLMEQMRGASGGMNMNMFNREQMAGAMGGMDADNDEDDDEEPGTEEDSNADDEIASADIGSVDNAELGEADLAAMSDIEQDPSAAGDRSTAGIDSASDEL